jgi:peptide/nickel transport system permease protein
MGEPGLGRDGSVPNELRLLRDYWGENHLGIIASCIVLLIVVTAVLAPYLAPFDPGQQHWERRLQPPSSRSNLEGMPPNWLGTDNLGRDVLSCLIYGARVSILVGLAGTALSVVLGTTLGLVAGYYGGILDSLIMRMADVQLAFPFTLLVIALVAVIGPSLKTTVAVLGVTGWVIFSRLVRGEVLGLREKEFVEAARAVGARDLTILWRHILPNVATPILVAATLQIPHLMIAEATLSFLGLGVPPSTPSWGTLLAQGKEFVWTAWWLGLFPGMALTLTALGVNLMGDWLRDILDPRLTRRLEPARWRHKS